MVRSHVLILQPFSSKSLDQVQETLPDLKSGPWPRRFHGQLSDEIESLEETKELDYHPKSASFPLSAKN